MTDPWSTWTNAAYPAIGAALVALDPGPSSLVLLGALTVLGFSSWQMHRLEDYGPWSWETGDQIGMHLTYAALTIHAVGGPWWAMLAGAVGLTAVLKFYYGAGIVRTMAAYAVVTFVAGAVQWAILPTVLGFTFIGLAVGAWTRGGDRWHGVWHLCSAAGTFFLYWIGV